EHSVNNLSEHVGAQPAAVSQHLAKLHLARMVTRRREGTFLHYSIENEHIGRLAEEALFSSDHVVSNLPDKHRHSDGEDHDHKGRLVGRLRSVFAPHSHDLMDSLDQELVASNDGMRALKVSLGVLALTACVELGIVAVSGSVALLGDTVHNFADALTALPLGLAFWLGRRPATRRYTYGYRPAEDLAGIFIVAVIATTSAFTAYAAIHRLVHPVTIHRVGLVMAAGVVGFLGNE